MGGWVDVGAPHTGVCVCVRVRARMCARAWAWAGSIASGESAWFAYILHNTLVEGGG